LAAAVPLTLAKSSVKTKENKTKTSEQNLHATALRQWLVLAVVDEHQPTAHVVPFYVHCVNCFMSWFHV